MPDTTFVPGTTVTSDWLNEVNDFVFNTPATDGMFTQTGTGAVERELKTKVLEVPISPEDFRASGYTDQQALTAAIAACNAAVIAAAGADPLVEGMPVLLIPNRTYTLTSDLTMPNCRIECQGRFVGAFNVIFSYPRRVFCRGLVATHIKVIGAFFSQWDEFKCSYLTITGGGYGFGTFWNSFTNCLADSILIDMDGTNWSVNQNLFMNGRGSCTTSGTASVASSEAHMNNFVNWDFTATLGGYRNTSSGGKNMPQMSTLTNVYVEGVGFDGNAGTATISGNVSINGLQGDLLTSPRVGKRNQVLGTTDVTERSCSDFLAYSGGNILNGGEWDVLSLDAGSGLYWPPCIVGYGSRVPTVITDTTEPSGVGKAAQFVLSAAGAGNAGVVLTVPCALSGKVAISFYWRGTTPESVEFKRITPNTSTYYGIDVTSAGGSWYLARFSVDVPTSGADNQLILDFGVAGGTFVIGGCYATAEKTARLPSYKADIRNLGNKTLEVQGTYTQWGVETKTSTAAVSNLVEVAVTFPTTYSTTPSITYSIENTDATNGPHMSKHWIKNGSVSTSGFTVQVYTAGATDNWQGKIHWQSVGTK